MQRLGKEFQIIREIVSLTKAKRYYKRGYACQNNKVITMITRERNIDELKVKNHSVLNSPYTYA
jgi:hypothetical protein